MLKNNLNLSLCFIVLLLLTFPSISFARITGFSLDIEPSAGNDSIAFVNVMAQYRSLLTNTDLLLSADAGTAWSDPSIYETTVNGTTKLLSEWLIDLCNETIIMSYDRNATNLLVRVTPYLDYADKIPNRSVIVGAAIATPGSTPTWWQTQTVKELEEVIASVDSELQGHSSFSKKYAIFYGETLLNATNAFPYKSIINETKTLWYISDKWVYDNTSRSNFFSFAKNQNVVTLYDAPHAGNRPHIGANKNDQQMYVDFINIAHTLGIDIQFMSGLNDFETDIEFIKSVNEKLVF
jgi:hypothetical protein